MNEYSLAKVQELLLEFCDDHRPHLHGRPFYRHRSFRKGILIKIAGWTSLPSCFFFY